MMLLLLAVAGGVGAGCRFVLDGLVRSRVTVAVPLGTLLINVTGSLLLGFVTGLALVHTLSPYWSVVVGTGFLGGYTTFSTASVELVRLLQNRERRAAALTAAAMLVLSVGAAASGMALAALT